jgi:SAM-dependent methyltransferase
LNPPYVLVSVTGAAEEDAMDKRQVALFRTREEEFGLLEAAIREKARGTQPLQILEAGCGRKWPLDLDGVSYSLTGVDADSRALELRETQRKDLNTVVVGDLRDPGLVPAGRFDVIYCSYVLEHVDGAETVLCNFLRWLRPGGLILLRTPDRGSAYGFAAWMSPFWLHVAYKKYVEKHKNAGRPGFDPYPTFYDQVVSRRGMRRFCRAQGCAIRAEFGQGYYVRTNRLITAAAFMMGLLSLGALAWRYNNLVYVIEKPATA